MALDGFNVVDARLLCSMLGGTAWESCQRGVSPVLLWDLHGATVDADGLALAVAAVLLRAGRGDRFGNMTALITHSEVRMREFERKQGERWQHQANLNYGALYARLGLSAVDHEAAVVTRFVRVLVEAAYGGVPTRRRYAARVAALWFEVCDTARGIHRGHQVIGG